MFLDLLAQAASENCGLNKDQPILLGVSGGADSLAMSFGLDQLGYRLIIAHVDHALRPESKAEADFMRELAKIQGWPIHIERIDVRKVAQQEGQSIEEAARHVRYRVLFEQAHLQRCQAVAVAHHADDQVETVLMHFIRGTALSGLTGMPYRRLMPAWNPDIPLVRPLLGFWREDIEDYVNTLGIEPCIDATNFDTTYYRNRLRHTLIPALETYNPQFKAAVLRMVDVLSEEESWLEVSAEQAFQECLLNVEEDRCQIDQSQFQMLPMALKRRVLRHAIALLRPDLRDIGFEAVARGVSFAESAKSGDEIDLVARLNLTLINDVLIIKSWEAELPDFNQPLLKHAHDNDTLGLDNPATLRHGWQVEASLLDARLDETLQAAIKDIPEDEAWLDFDRLDFPLSMRGMRKGERFNPLGMQGHSQSLQNFFVNLKIPAHLRPIWPLVISNERIAWVVGLRPAEDFKITSTTQRILILKLHKRAEP